MKPSKNSKIAILILLSGVILGFVISQGTIFTFFYAALVTVICFALTLLTVVSDLITKKKLFIYPGLATLGLVVAIGVGLIRFKWVQNQKQTAAEELVVELNNYQADVGRYPDLLNELPTERDLTIFNYRSDLTKESYHLSFSWDGWHQQGYDSETGIWTLSD